MLSSLFLLAGSFAATVFAKIPGLPDCAQQCIGNSFGNCGLLDVKCICSNNYIVEDLGCCVVGNCTTADLDTTFQFAQGICGPAGATPAIPTDCKVTYAGSGTGSVASATPAPSSTGTGTGIADAVTTTSGSTSGSTGGAIAAPTGVLAGKMAGAGSLLVLAGVVAAL